MLGYPRNGFLTLCVMLLPQESTLNATSVLWNQFESVALLLLFYCGKIHIR